MRAQTGAPFAALMICGILAVGCATGERRQPYVHPKAQKAQNASTGDVKVAPAPVVTAPAIAPTPAVIAPPPLVAVPPLPQVVPPVLAQPNDALPSEIPTRVRRRDIPDWTSPTPKAATPIPVRPQTVPMPVPVPAREPVPVPVPVLAPVRAAIPLPVPVPVRATAPVPVPTPTSVTPAIPTPPAPLVPVASTTPSSGPLVIDRPNGTIQSRLPCNRGGSPHCDLRIYQINVGTFVDGSPEHNPISGYGPGPHTGDIEGVMGALDHIKALGFNTIWLTPIFDTQAGAPQSRPAGPPQVNTKLDGTGYFPRDYFKIDPQFGTLEQTQALVDQAHALGIKVMFDGVFGHNKGDVVAAPSGALPVSATRPSAYDGPPANYPGRIVDYSNAASTTFYKEAARYWIDTLGIDGWRLDQVYQIPSAPLREITTEITRAANAQLLSGYVVGEMWGTAEQIRGVLGPSDNPALASAFDFPTRYALVQTLASDENGGANKPASTINEAWALGAHATYPDHAIMNLMLGNHDLVRFGDLIERAGKGGPNSPNYWAIHKMAFTFMAAWSGPITLYYGEEIGAEVPDFGAKVSGDCASLDRCDDHVARNMVAIAGVNARANASTAPSRNLKLYLTMLMSLRAANPALSSGARTHIYSDKDLYIDLKTAGSERFALVMNVGSAPRAVTLTPRGLGMAALQAGRIEAGQTQIDMSRSGMVLTIPALGAAIIKLEGT